MRGKLAKRLRRTAEAETIGAPADVTKMLYKKLKRLHRKGGK